MVSTKNLQPIFYFIIKDQMTVVITFIQRYTQGLANAIRQEKEIWSIKVGKEGKNCLYSQIT